MPLPETVAVIDFETTGASPGQGGRADADPLMKRVLDDLIKRKSARPATPKTLKNTMQKCCGSEVPADRIEALYVALVERGYVRVESTKLKYSLPEVSQVRRDGRIAPRSVRVDRDAGCG